MRYLPVSFDTKDKNVLVLGGGLLALSKINELLKTEFNVYVIADTFVDQISELEKKYEGRLFTKKETLTENFIFFAYDYLIIATNNFELNSAYEKRAQKIKMLYERCDITSESTMLLNKVIETDNITVGISTNKLNPTITEIIYEDISKLLSNYNDDKIKILNDIRTELIKKNSPNVDEIIKELYTKEKLTLETYYKNLNYKDEPKTTESIEDLEKLIKEPGKITEKVEDTTITEKVEEITKSSEEK